MRIKILGLGICFLWILYSSLFAEKAVILKQEDAPLKISEYKSTYSYYERTGTITHSTRCINISGKTIVAVSIGLVAFDVSNEFLDKFGGVAIKDMKVNEEKKFSWQQRPYKAFMFKKYGTGIAYVGAVRFEDATMWKVDEGDIVSQIQEIQESFTADLLKEKGEDK